MDTICFFNDLAIPAARSKTQRKVAAPERCGSWIKKEQTIPLFSVNSIGTCDTSPWQVTPRTSLSPATPLKQTKSQATRNAYSRVTLAHTGA